MYFNTYCGRYVKEICCRKTASLKINTVPVLYCNLKAYNKSSFTIYNSRDLSGTLPEQPSHFKPICNQPFLLKSKRLKKKKTA